MRWGTAAAVAAAGMLVARPLVAQPSEADQQQAAALAREGEKLGNENKLRDALFKFKAAARLDPSTPAYLCNVGLAHYGLSDLARAHLNLSRCFAASGSWPAGVKDVFDYVVAELDKRDVAKVAITGVPEDAIISIKEFADEGELHAPIEVYLAGGNYIYEASAPGYQTAFGEIRVEQRGALKDQYRLKPIVGGEAGTGDSGPIGVIEDDAGGGDVHRAVTPQPRSRRKLYGWITVGAGGVLGIVGGGLYLAARSTYTTLSDGDYDPADYDTLKDRFEFRYNGSIVAGIGAGVLAAAGAALILTAPDEPAQATLSMAPSAGGGMVWFTWQR